MKSLVIKNVIKETAIKVDIELEHKTTPKANTITSIECSLRLSKYSDILPNVI